MDTFLIFLAVQHYVMMSVKFYIEIFSLGVQYVAIKDMSESIKKKRVDKR